jgi:hypothetical protein
MGCMRALGNLVHALRLRPPEHVDYRDPSLVRGVPGQVRDVWAALESLHHPTSIVLRPADLKHLAGIPDHWHVNVNDEQCKGVRIAARSFDYQRWNGLCQFT